MRSVDVLKPIPSLPLRLQKLTQNVRLRNYNGQNTQSHKQITGRFCR